MQLWADCHSELIHISSPFLSGLFCPAAQDFLFAIQLPGKGSFSCPPEADLL